MMLALDAGAEDFADEEDSYEIITDPDDFSAVREAGKPEKDGIAMAEVRYHDPQTYVELTDPQALKDLNRTWICWMTTTYSTYIPILDEYCHWKLHRIIRICAY